MKATIIFSLLVFVTMLSRAQYQTQSYSKGDGYCLVLVQSDKQAGQIKLKATSDALESREIFIVSK